MLLDALDSNKLAGDVLEIASGTGIWAEALTRHASSITALDSSQEMIERCKTRLRGNPKVRYVHADFYAWTPRQTIRRRDIFLLDITRSKLEA